MRSFECDVTADVLWRSLVADVDSPRPIVLSHPLSRRDPETPVHTDSVHKCNSENINVRVSDSDTAHPDGRGPETATGRPNTCRHRLCTPLPSVPAW